MNQLDVFRHSDADLAAELLNYDPETGEFRWRVHRGSRSRAGSLAGCWSGGPGYMTIFFKGRNHYAHRLAWLLMTGDWPSGVVDHINRDKRDNRWRNLRAISRMENAQNTNQTSQGSSGIRGVVCRRDTGKWYARIKAGNLDLRMGPLPDREFAALVREEAHRKFHPAAYHQAEAEKLEARRS